MYGFILCVLFQLIPQAGNVSPLHLRGTSNGNVPQSIGTLLAFRIRTECQKGIFRQIGGQPEILSARGLGERRCQACKNYKMQNDLRINTASASAINPRSNCNRSRRARAFAPLKAGNNNAANMPMIAMTTSSSISMKPRRIVAPASCPRSSSCEYMPADAKKLQTFWLNPPGLSYIIIFCVQSQNGL